MTAKMRGLGVVIVLVLVQVQVVVVQVVVVQVEARLALPLSTLVESDCPPPAPGTSKTSRDAWRSPTYTQTGRTWPSSAGG